MAWPRGTHGLYIVQQESSSPLEFLQRAQFEMKHSSYIEFKGMPQDIIYKEPEIDDNIVVIPTYYVTPTDLIKFVSEGVIEYITPILERIFVQETDKDDEEEIDIPRIIQTDSGLFEEVSDLNGIALPAMYFDEIQGHKKDGEQVLKNMINTTVQEMKANKHIYLKEMVKAIPEKCETPSDYLYLANVYVAIQERLYSKLKQIENYDWITSEIKDKCVSRLNANLGYEFNNEDDEILIIPHGEHKINLAQYIYELIILSVPAKRIHPGVIDGSLKSEILNILEDLKPKENKKTVDPRWEKLKEIITNK